MQIQDDLHLTYCTNIHAATGWREVRDSIEQCAPELKRRLSPDEPFGLGLRLSNEEARSLLADGELPEFREFLDRHGLYVFTMNGFPYGAFHGETVKEDVHRPDWRTEARVEYTERLAEILAALAPSEIEPGISTNPLTYRHWEGVDAPAARRRMVEHLVDVVETFARIDSEGGPTIHLDIEPEPDGLLETTSELVEFFESSLLGEGAALLAERRGVSDREAETLIRRHVRMCLDTCHAAVQFESADALLDRIDEAGLRIGKVQVSSALDVDLADDPDDRGAVARALAAYDEPVYLHQVVQRNRDGSYRSFRDLGPALEEIWAPEADRWRIHFHVPLYRRGFEAFGSTQSEILEVFDEFEDRGVPGQLEIETYTWEVLSEDEKLDLVDSIEREFQWVRDVLD